MKTHSLRVLLLATASALAACGDNSGARLDGPISTTAVADREILNNTSDTALPIPLDGTIRDDDLSDSALPMSL
jgi:hypothetical protein